MTTALIIDDHPIVLEGFIRSIEAIGACKAVGTSSLLEGFRRYRQIKPDIVVLDLSFRDNVFAGLSMLRRLRKIDAAIPILVFSMHDDPTVVKQVLVAGANGFVQKDIAPDVIGEAFNRVLAGGSFLMPEIATRVALLNQRQENPILNSLSSREMEILALISRGSSYSDVADKLGISYKTVANTASILKSKLSARSLPELVIKSIRLLQ